jgi:molecular chaperone GrpE (heat shock protein)
MTKSEIKTLEMIKDRLTETLENEDLKSEKSKDNCISAIIDVIGSLNHAINYAKEKQEHYKEAYEDRKWERDNPNPKYPSSIYY